MVVQQWVIGADGEVMRRGRKMEIDGEYGGTSGEGLAAAVVAKTGQDCQEERGAAMSACILLKRVAGSVKRRMAGSRVVEDGGRDGCVRDSSRG
ncbi:hypothetical protein AMTR_s00047p00022300 [Amborella trichopoda]|uniref:Uncharacterized protein n=1 Tax=Amborella trichopoda TaxID=13333 RepID=U5CWK2_AMBTC|nr:hypothetical protein AMTR_s00047p00022300 [Amborella trichopoda]